MSNPLTRFRILLVLAILLVGAVGVYARLREPIPVVFFGDSITAYWDIAAAIPGAVNAGEPGALSAVTFVRYEDEWRKRPFKTAVVLIGVNDLIAHISEATLEDNVTELLRSFYRDGRHIYAGSLLPQSGDYAYLRARTLAFNTWLESQQHALSFVYIDYYTAMLDPATEQAQDGLLKDGLHPAAAGYAVMRRVLLQTYSCC